MCKSYPLIHYYFEIITPHAIYCNLTTTPFFNSKFFCPTNSPNSSMATNGEFSHQPISFFFSACFLQGIPHFFFVYINKKSPFSFGKLVISLLLAWNCSVFVFSSKVLHVKIRQCFSQG
ncbi:hypothetical protein ES288_D09G015700v1 [Gossypium darwinii]|uniref:Uncharacterized protein n=2 Tax=Gossypium TaxID=3633 RepID=A0A5D2JBI2_GOSTO|nr:hypothetical protein ES288_D09G015700v1 [Gossypium darwinii]TYH52277.1 hypothetical protein ES332_D09G015500v1 [Gossypium tomentosum]